MPTLNNLSSNLWGYLFLTIIFVYSSYAQFVKTATNNELILKGKILKTIIVERPKSCSNSNRASNYCQVKDQNNREHKLQINYNDCINLNLGDTILIRQSDDIDKVLRYNPEVKISNYYFEAILFALGLASFITFGYYLIRFIKKTKF